MYAWLKPIFSSIAIIQGENNINFETTYDLKIFSISILSVHCSHVSFAFSCGYIRNRRKLIVFHHLPTSLKVLVWLQQLSYASAEDMCNSRITGYKIVALINGRNSIIEVSFCGYFI